LAEFKNPQQEPGMDRRMLIIFGITFLAIMFAQPLLKKYFPQAVPAPTQQLSKVETAPAAAPPPVVAPTPVKRSVAGSKASASTPSVTQAASESETVIENSLYRITFTNRGAQVKSWILKTYDDDRGQPLDIVNQAAAAKDGLPLSLWTYDEAQRNKLNSVLYVASVAGSKSDAGSQTVAAPTEISFDYSDADITVHKAFRFDDSYVMHLETSVVHNGAYVTALPAWPSGLEDHSLYTSYHLGQIEYQLNDKTTHLDIKKISGGGTLHGPFDWAGVGVPYFAAVFIPENPESASLVTLRNSLMVPKNLAKPNEDLAPVDVLGVAVGDLAGPTSARLFVGPKSLAVLQSISVPTVNGAEADLRTLVNFGTWGIIARPLFAWLRWTYRYTHNWGWAIVLQTLIITLVLLPLRVSSMKSALKMQKIQPQMNAIKEKYKKYAMRDPKRQEMNTEIGALMKAEGVNPIGGCLPLIIQLPFFWSYYKMLSIAIDLRHAHWLWISDLSGRDPYFLLPTIMVISMVVTQRMTPQTGMDPAQQKMMTITMPLMMGFIFYNLAAGLNLYYAESNLITIVQQVVMNRTSLGREMKELAAKRARKKLKT
jgi:YidC/Oxa1 family membrane protein insertase